MKRTRLSVFLLLVLFALGACGQTASTRDQDTTLILISSGGETSIPYRYWSWDTRWTGRGWVAGDALQLTATLPEIAGELPTILYHQDFAVEYQKDVSFSHMSVFDETFDRIAHLADYDKIAPLTYLSQLSEGTYYVSFAVSKPGRYIRSEKRSESNGYECVFKLLVTP